MLVLVALQVTVTVELNVTVTVTEVVGVPVTVTEGVSVPDSVADEEDVLLNVAVPVPDGDGDIETVAVTVGLREGEELLLTDPVLEGLIVNDCVSLRVEVTDAVTEKVGV